MLRSMDRAATPANFLLDNASNNDGYTNIAIPFPGPDAVQEVSVQTSTFDAQYGHAAGGVVSIVTRSGTNSFHGKRVRLRSKLRHECP